MACLKCGSDWKTLKGKDMVSCPECCKQQRCKARKQGRLPASETKACERCGQSFDAVGGNAMARSFRCPLCVQEDLLNGERQRRHRERVKLGLFIPGSRKQNACRARRQCQWCQKELNAKDQHKYCSKRCFADARKAGRQEWNRTNQLESVWHRGGRWACAPSRKPIEEMRTNMMRFLGRVQKAYHMAMRGLRPCKVCHVRCGERFCSDACSELHSRESVARAREAARLYRKAAGRHFKQRAKRHGVAYERFPKSLIYERDNYTCQLCNEPVLKTAQYRKSDGKIHLKSPTIDHIIPMSKGGDHVPHNCQTACFGCNSKKGNRMIGQLRLAMQQ